MGVLNRLPKYPNTSAEIDATKGAILDVGCGKDKILGAVGIDIAAESDADILHDLKQIPWPVADDSFDVIRLHSIVEHLPDTVATITEVYRIGKPGATVLIGTPHFSSANAFTDPTHVHFFSARFMDYFIEGSDLSCQYGFYARVRFRLLERQVTLAPFWRRLRLTRLMNRILPVYETYLCNVIRGADIHLKLMVLKETPTRASTQ